MKKRTAKRFGGRRSRYRRRPAWTVLIAGPAWLAASHTAAAAPEDAVAECNSQTRAIVSSFEPLVAQLQGMQELETACTGTGVYEARMARLYIDVGMFDKVEESLQAGLALRSGYENELLAAQLTLASVLRRFDAAEANAATLLERHPDWPEGHIAVAMMHFHQGDFAAAIVQLDRANAIAESGRAYSLLVVMHFLENDPANSVAAFERAMQIDNRALYYTSAATATARSLLALGRPEEGRELLRRHAALNPAAAASPDYQFAIKQFEPQSGNEPKKLAVIEDLKSGDLVSAGTDTSAGAGVRETVRTRPVVDPEKPRSDAEIQYVFHENSNAIFTVYNRALRRNPNLSGRVVIRLEVTPEGKVANCSIEESEIDDEDFLDKLRKRISTLEFEPIRADKSVTVLKPIDFSR